ncbi:hypothetical protein JQ608_06735 [Bradyrhizobium liaoningense]|uniref:hypothetical protein n=1 Tax=Bradyrhizobium liaoningense TaxID=43992 RepID=UPI001BAD0AFE|nr:hypothetical protein [Bradyrhizobium liaoningense]MBR0876897.1 hypothetical protein [Bradyrhizobium liaoningense]
MQYQIRLPRWREFEAKIDNPTAATLSLLEKAEPTTRARFLEIASLWLPSVQMSILDGNFGTAYIKLRAFYVFLRAHNNHLTTLLEAVVDQCRAYEFVMHFVSSHPEGISRIEAEMGFANDESRYAELLLLLAVLPDDFSNDEVASLFVRLPADAFRAAWANHE